MTDRELSDLARDYFGQIAQAEQEIHRLTVTIESWRDSLTSIGGGLNPDKVRSGSDRKRPMEDTVCRIDELERSVNVKRDELAALKCSALVQIGKLSDLDQQNVLVARYVLGKQWADIARSFGASLPFVYKLHKRALISFAEIISAKNV